MADSGITASQLWTFLKTAEGTATTDEIQQELVSAGLPAGLASGIAGIVATGSGTFTLPDADGINLGNAINPFLDGLVELPDDWLTADLTGVSVTLGNSRYAFTATLTISVTLMQQSVTIATALNLTIDNSGQAPVPSGQIAGTVTIADFANISATYALTPTTSGLAFSWQPASGNAGLSNLLDLFGQDTLASEVNSLGLDTVTISQLSFSVSLVNSGVKIGDVAVTTSLGAAMLRITDTGSTAYVICIETEAADFNSLKSINGKFDIDLKIDDSLLVYASDNIAGFEVPVLNPGWKAPYSDPNFTVSRGLTLVTGVDLAGSGDATVAKLGNTLELDAGLTLTATIAQSGDVSIAVTIGAVTMSGYSLDLTLGITFDDGVELELTGTLDLQAKFGIELAVEFSVSDDAVAGDLFMQTEDVANAIAVPGVSGLWISGLGGSFSFELDSGEVSAGLGAFFEISAEASGNPPTGTPQMQSQIGALVPPPGAAGGDTVPNPAVDEIALILGYDPVDEVVDVDLFLLRVDSLSLGGAISALSDNAIDGGFVTVLEGIEISDLLLYWCDQAPNSLNMPMSGKPIDKTGFQFRGQLDLYGEFRAFGDLEITQSAFKGAAVLSEINLDNILVLSGPSGEPVEGSPQAIALAEAQAVGIVPPGAVFTFDSTGDTTSQVTAEWNATLFNDALGTSGNLVIAKDVWMFDFDASADHNQVFGMFSFNMQTDLSQMYFMVDVQIDDTVTFPVLGVDVTVSIDSGFDLTMSYAAGAFTVSGSFTFQGTTLTLPTVSLSDAGVTVGSLDDIPNAILRAIEHEAQTVFNDILYHVEKWISDYGDEAKNWFEKKWDEFKDELKDLKDAVEAVLDARDAAPKPAYAKDGAMVQCGSPLPPFDPNDPRTDPNSVFVVHHYRLRAIPDLTTLDALGGPDFSTIGVPGPNMMTMPLDVVRVPSRVPGQICARMVVTWTSVYDVDIKGTGQFYVAVEEWDGSGLQKALYPIHSDTGLRAALGANYPATVIEAVDHDIDAAPSSKLKTPATLFNTDGGMDGDGPTATNQPRYAFWDGGIHYIPDWITYQYFSDDMGENHLTGVSGATITALSGNPLPSIQDGTLVQSEPNFADGTPANAFYSNGNAAIYLADAFSIGKNTVRELRQFKDMQSISNWGYDASKIVTLPAEVMSMLRYGDEMSEKKS